MAQRPLSDGGDLPPRVDDGDVPPLVDDGGPPPLVDDRDLPPLVDDERNSGNELAHPPTVRAMQLTHEAAPRIRFKARDATFGSRTSRQAYLDIGFPERKARDNSNNLHPGSRHAAFRSALEDLARTIRMERIASYLDEYSREPKQLFADRMPPQRRSDGAAVNTALDDAEGLAEQQPQNACVLCHSTSGLMLGVPGSLPGFIKEK
ncbi:hypothetical protein AURDEDRAFT_177100 [Auricularia subglabra TFB-10046 SS5]|uniref:Uncharacterized protein n=1 Tax=Auricularia subglabra (strain TFB-10046 / SS5) TaxID=717982 RepID=J0LBJ8_AURST|nr:hypothetical protein AURDEDRAFT_177100 [Auricularia subglabra TFB-10046 SS5]